MAITEETACGISDIGKRERAGAGQRSTLDGTRSDDMTERRGTHTHLTRVGDDREFGTTDVLAIRIGIGPGTDKKKKKNNPWERREGEELGRKQERRRRSFSVVARSRKNYIDNI